MRIWCEIIFEIFKQVRGLVPYVVGRYVIEEAHELSSSDIFTSGMVALTDSVESPELLMEHIYPAEPQTVPMIKQTLTTGLELKLDRAHDLSAVIHVERFNDGRIMLTAIPLLYGTYTVMRGTGTFSLEPPLTLNLEAGWPVFKEQARFRGEMHYTQFKEGRGQPQTPTQVAIPGFGPSGTPPPADNQLIRVEAAVAVTPPPIVQTKNKSAKATPTPKGKLAKGKPTPKASASASPIVIAEKSTPASPRQLRPTSRIRHLFRHLRNRRPRRFSLRLGPQLRNRYPKRRWLRQCQLRSVLNQFNPRVGHGHVGVDNRRRHMENVSGGKNADRPADWDKRS